MQGKFAAQSLALLVLLGLSSTATAQVVINGVEYREITDLGQPRVARAQPQLGSSPALATVGPRYAQYAPPLPSQPNVVWPTQAPAAADQRPSLNPLTLSTQPSPAAYNRPYAYGYGYANGCSWANNSGYGNTLPPPGVQPISSIQPAYNVQPLATGPVNFNPYQSTQRSVPWRPIVPIRSMPLNYEIGQGIIGQPKVYVPSQPVRNFIRYITP